MKISNYFFMPIKIKPKFRRWCYLLIISIAIGALVTFFIGFYSSIILSFGELSYLPIDKSAPILITSVSSFCGLFAAFLGVKQLIRGNKEKAESLLWRKAEMGKRLLDELFNNELAVDAFKILDLSEHIITSKSNGEKYNIYHCNIPRYLCVDDNELILLTEKEIEVRYRFDAILQSFSYLEHYIRIGLVREKDVKSPLKYYVVMASKFKADILNYGNRFGFDLGIDFLMRFEDFKNKEIIVNANAIVER